MYKKHHCVSSDLVLPNMFSTTGKGLNRMGPCQAQRQLPALGDIRDIIRESGSHRHTTRMKKKSRRSS